MAVQVRRGRVPGPFALAMIYVSGVDIRVCMLAEAGTRGRPMAQEWAYGIGVGSGGNGEQNASLQ